MTKTFIMSPKVDFAFKLLFGDEKNKDLLIELLAATLKMPKGDFQGIELLNTELFREFKEDRKGILDIRVGLRTGVQIDVEIQILPTRFMPERTLFYWSKMYTQQIKSGDTYARLKKCITINIVDFECIETNKIHTQYHLTEDTTGEKLTDVIEVHFLEIPKLKRLEDLKDANDPIIEWLQFLDAKSEEVMEMLAKKNEGIDRAYELLKRFSQNELTRMGYESRQAELMDQMTREEEAEERGIQKEKINIARALLDILDDKTIALKTGMSIEAVKTLRGDGDVSRKERRNRKSL